MVVRVGRDGAVEPVDVGGPQLVLIAGPCSLESSAVVMAAAEAVAESAAAHGLPWIFKGSFDKANRSGATSWRGPGLARGLELLAMVRERFGVPVTTDVHRPEQAAVAAEVVDLLQVPAFLCRQTDLLTACAETGAPVNVKKGQFLAPESTQGIVDKLAGAGGVILTERGTTFGHGDLVVDYRGISALAATGAAVCLDATHSTQRPARGQLVTGGARHHAATLARAGVAVGIDALFVEVHPCPDQARSDAATQLPAAALSEWLRPVVAIDRAVRGAGRCGASR